MFPYLLQKKSKELLVIFFYKTVIVNARGLDLFILTVLFVILLSTETAVGCPDHNNRPLEFYDKDDCQPVCSHCVVTGERQTHAIAPIDEIVSKFFFFFNLRVWLNSCNFYIILSFKKDL